MDNHVSESEKQAMLAALQEAALLIRASGKKKDGYNVQVIGRLVKIIAALVVGTEMQLSDVLNLPESWLLRDKLYIRDLVNAFLAEQQAAQNPAKLNWKAIAMWLVRFILGSILIWAMITHPGIIIPVIVVIVCIIQLRRRWAEEDRNKRQ